MLKCKSRKVLRGYCCLLFNLEKTAIELSTLLFYKFALFFFFPLQMIKCKNIVKINFITRIEDIKKNCSKKYLCLSSKSNFLSFFSFFFFFFFSFLLPEKLPSTFLQKSLLDFQFPFFFFIIYFCNLLSLLCCICQTTMSCHPFFFFLMYISKPFSIVCHWSSLLLGPPVI